MQTLSTTENNLRALNTCDSCDGVFIITEVLNSVLSGLVGSLFREMGKDCASCTDSKGYFEDAFDTINEFMNSNFPDWSRDAALTPISTMIGTYKYISQGMC